MLQWSTMLTNMMSGLFQKFNVLEVCLGAADRMFQYQKVETEFEAMRRTDDNTPEDWPPEGAINFRNVSAKYPGEQKYVLKDIALNIKAGEKVRRFMLLLIFDLYLVVLFFYSSLESPEEPELASRRC